MGKITYIDDDEDNQSPFRKAEKKNPFDKGENDNPFGRNEGGNPFGKNENNGNNLKLDNKICLEFIREVEDLNTNTINNEGLSELIQSFRDKVNQSMNKPIEDQEEENIFSDKVPQNESKHTQTNKENSNLDIENNKKEVEKLKEMKQEYENEKLVFIKSLEDKSYTISYLQNELEVKQKLVKYGIIKPKKNKKKH